MSGAETADDFSSGSGREMLRSFKTILEMLVDRGEDVSAIEDKPIATVLTESGAGKSDVFAVDVNSSLRVVYNLHPKLKMTDLKKQLDSRHRTYIIVAREKHPLSKTAAMASDGQDGSPRDVQFFELAELQYNVSRHSLVPSHTAIRDEGQIEELMRRYVLKSRYQLPLILSTDPMARYLALKPGQIVRIVRSSPSAGTDVYYRCCQRA